jgi:co-chaperonin GroES (HSP10)
VGPGRRDGDNALRAIEGIEVGSRVFYSKYAGNEIALEFGEENALVVLREEDLLAVEEA